MGFVSTLSGHIVIEDGVRLDEVLAVVRELPEAAASDWPPLCRDDFSSPAATNYKGERVITFGFTAKELEDEFGEWLTRFEALLARVLDATGQRRAICRASVLFDSATRQHPSGTGGLHVYVWSRNLDTSEEAPALRLQHDDVLTGGFSSRFACSNSERVDTLVDDALENSQLFGLRGQGWARATDAAGVARLPFWGSAEAASRAARGQWAGYVPKAIALDAFLAEWLTGMQEDGILAALNPGPTDEGELVSALELREHFAKRQP